MTDTSARTNGRAPRAARRDRRGDPAARIAELEAENAALRRALARADLGAERPRGGPGEGGPDWAGDAAAAAAGPRRGRETAAEREERPRLVLDSAADYAILTTGLDRRVTSWNAGAERLTGWSEAEVVGRPADTIFTPEDRAAGVPEREAAGALRDGRAADERWHLRKDGSRFWGSGLVMPLRDPAAGPGAPPLGLLKIMRDRTKRRRAEEALAARERRLRLLADTAAWLLAAADPDEVLGPVFQALSEEFGVDISFSYVVDPEGGGLRLASCFGLPEESRAGFARLALGQAVCGAAAQARRAVHLADARASEDPAAAGIRALGVRAYAVFPLVAGGGRLVGTLSFGSRVRARFSEDDLAFLGTVAHHVAVVRERLRAEAALREAEDHLRHTVELNPQIPWTADPEGRITGFNERWLEVTGLSRGASIGEGWMEVPHPEDREGMAAAWVRAISTGEPYDVEARLRVADGSFRWWRARAFPRRDAAGRIVRWYGSTEDIHDRKEAEERLREGEARWRSLFESMQEGLEIDELVHGPDGRPTDFRYLGVNPAWERHTGIPREAAVGRLLSEVVPGLDPFWVETYARVVETGEPVHVERFVPQLGRWYEVRAHRTAGTGRFASLVMDITGRKTAEARWDALVEFGDRLRHLRGPGEIAHAAAEVIGRTLGALRAGYAAVDADKDGIRIERDWTRDPSVAGLAGAHRLSDHWAAPLIDDLRRGGVVAIDNVARDPRTAAHADRLAAFGIRACVHAPLVERGRVVVLYVHDAAPRAWTEEEVAFIRGVADRAWAAAERARADEALRASEGHRRAALTAARLGTFEWDLATDAVALDGRAREMFGFRPGEGGSAPEVFGRIHPEDRARVFAESRAAAGSMSRLDTEYRVSLPDGTARAVASLGDFAPVAAGRMLGVFADITDRKLAEERRALLVNELNHRVKNTLAVVQSLALQTARGAADLPAFSAAFQARLVALARAHDLLTRESWEGAVLADVVRTALEAAGGTGRVDFACGCRGGPGAMPLLAPAQALALAMALHELATNALKHGALSAPGGRVSVRCHAEPGSGARVVEWLERGGPRVEGPPARRGFGLRLLERGLATQAGMATDLRFEPEGLCCALRLPPATR